MLRISTSSLVVSSVRWSVWRAAEGVGSIEPSTARSCWWDSPAAFAVRVISQVGAYRKRSAAAFCCRTFSARTRAGQSEHRRNPSQSPKPDYVSQRPDEKFGRAEQARGAGPTPGRRLTRSPVPNWNPSQPALRRPVDSPHSSRFLVLRGTAEN
jgi:hypothetical protein